MQAIIKRHPLSAILLTAVLTLAALTLPARLPNLHGDATSTVTLAEEGTGYGLSGITDWNNRAVILLPGSTYYPNVLLTPKIADAETAVSTSEFAALRADYLSQRFVLNLPDTNDAYTLTFKLSGRHAMRVYANGTLAGETGRVGTAKQDTEVWENNITVSASPLNGKTDILLNSAQTVIPCFFRTPACRQDTCFSPECL